MDDGEEGRRGGREGREVRRGRGCGEVDGWRGEDEGTGWVEERHKEEE